MRPNHKHDLYDSNIIGSDNVSLITKLRLGPQIMVLRYDKKSFFNRFLGVTPYRDYKDYGNEYYSGKNRNWSIIKKIHLKSDCMYGSILDGCRQPVLHSFVLDKPPGYKIFSEPETIHYKRENKSVLNTKKFYLEDDNHGEVNFTGGTLTFFLQMIKI